MSEFANAMVVIEEQTIVIQGTCQWTIPDFAIWMNTLQPSGQPFTSPEFQIRSVLPVPVSKFQIRVNRSSPFSDISFQLKNAGASPIRVLDFSVCSRNKSTSTTFLFQLKNISLGPNTLSSENSLVGFYSQAKDLNLFISCKLEHTIKQNNPFEPLVGSLAHDLKVELDRSEIADVVLVCQGKEFKCLRTLLALR